jgi:hypothetical protein
MLASPGVTQAAGQDSSPRLEQSLATRPPTGFERAGAVVAVDPGLIGDAAVGVERSFAPTDGGRDRITLRLWDPTRRSGAAFTIAMLREIARSQSPFDASAVAPRAFGWRQPAGGKRETFVVFRPHGAWIIQAMYTAAAARPRAAVARTLRQVVREQLERPAPAPARTRRALPR